jgi:hypothetical protein
MNIIEKGCHLHCSQSKERFESRESFYLARDKKHNAVATVLFIIMESALLHRCSSSSALTQMAGGTNLLCF